MFQSYSISQKWYKDWFAFCASVETVLWVCRKVCEQKNPILNSKYSANRCHQPQLTWLFVFSTERSDKGSDDHRVHTRVHLLRGMYLSSIEAACNTHLYTLYIHTHFRTEERNSARKAFKQCAVCVRIQLGTIVAFRQVLIYLGWACSIWKHPQQRTDRKTKKFQSSGAKKLNSDLVIMAQLL